MSYKSNGVNLDSIFAARLAAARPDTGLRIAGVDIAQRYEPLHGASPKVPATGIRSGGVDLNMLFDNVAETPVNFSGTASGEDFGSGSAGAEIGFRPNGSIYGFFTPSGSVSVSPSWFDPNRTGVGNDYDIHIHVNSQSGGGSLYSSGFDTWLQCNVDRLVGINAPVDTFHTASIQVIFRLRSSGAWVCSGTLSLSASGGTSGGG